MDLKNRIEERQKVLDSVLNEIAKRKEIIENTNKELVSLNQQAIILQGSMLELQSLIEDEEKENEKSKDIPEVLNK